MLPDPADQDDVLERVRKRLFVGAEVPTEPSLGSYERIEKIGEGGMGVVWRAHDPVLARTVALKEVRTASPRTHARLLAEGRALARVSHPNVVQIFEVIESAGQISLAMEYVQGRTLLEWTRDASWPAILKVLVQAGRGLAATHASGIAHRDFKPDNVIVDDEGRARVVDFGLARDVGEDAGESQHLTTLGGEPTERTRTGTVVGTPAYMSPEQFEGRRGDALSDQYSFCVTAYEVLFGVPPISGCGDEFKRNVLAGNRTPRPADSPVPLAVLAMLDRGLAVEPKARWPDISALLDALEEVPRRRQRWRHRLAIGAGGLAIAAAVWAGTDARADLCSGASERLVGVWDFERRAAVEKAILATQTPFARESATAVVRSLDAYARRWELAHTEACEATHRRGDQSPTQLDERTSCLTARLHELDTVAHVIEGTDPASVHAVLQAAQRLPAIEECAVQAQEVDRPAPAGPAANEVRARLVQVRALFNAGRPLAAYTLAEEVARTTEDLGDERLGAEATYQLGLLAGVNADPERGEALLRRSYLAAERFGMSKLARDAAWRLGVTVGYVQERASEGEWWADIAEAKTAFVTDPIAQARVSMLRSNLASVRGDPREALRHDQVALDRLTRAFGSEHLDVARLRVNLGISLRGNGQREAARIELGQALASLERTVGPQHPDVAGVLNELGNLAAEQKQFDEAARHYERTLAIWVQVYGPSHPDTALALKNLGVIENRRGRTEKAVQHLTRALAIREEVLGPEHSETLSTVHALATIDLEQGRLARARAGYDRVLAARERARGVDHPSLVPPLAGLASVAEKAGERAQAITLAERAEAIDLRGPAVAQTGALALLLGRLLQTSDPGRAITIYQRDIERIKATFGPDHPDLAELRDRLREADGSLPLEPRSH